MTINQLMECALGKICTATGEDGDATAYAVKENYTQEINNKLVNLGFHAWGNEPMACGLTGELLECDVFIGPTYYQRLKHLVDDKIHARARGKVTKLYRQAPDGRGVGGGLRLGEMERDALIALGTSKFLTERLLEMSDLYETEICNECGNIATSKNGCQACKTDDVSRVRMPYANKILLYMLQGMGLKVGLTAKK